MTPVYLGNIDLLEREKIAFFCSRRYAPQAVLASYDWATAQHDKIVISTFHSPLERDVMDFLLQKKQPFIYVLSTRMYSRIPARFKEPLAEGRLLIVSLFPNTVIRYNNQTAYTANRYILSKAFEAVFGSIAEGSHTEKLYHTCSISKHIL